MTVIHFVDCETSGLDETRDEILSCCIARWENGKSECLYSERFHALGSVSDFIGKLTGYGSPDWIASQPRYLVDAEAERISKALEGCEILAGSNPSFDERFLRATFARLRVDFPKIGHRKIDTSSLAAPLLLAGLIEKTGLEHLMKFFGLGDQKHDAHDDVFDSIACFERLFVGAWNGWGRKAAI